MTLLLFLFACGGSETAVPKVCKDYSKCAAAVYPQNDTLKTLVKQTYGNEGTCWESTGDKDADAKTAELCEAICGDTLDAYYQFSGNPECGDWGGSELLSGKYAVKNVSIVEDPCDLGAPDTIDVIRRTPLRVDDLFSGTSECEGEEPDFVCTATQYEGEAVVTMLSWSTLLVDVHYTVDECLFSATFEAVSKTVVVPAG